jgi:starvation-inducible outer membrane lipoprotein
MVHAPVGRSEVLPPERNPKMTLIGALILLLAVLTGCVATTKDVRVLQSKSEISVKNIQIEDNDTLLCDPEGCRKLR